MFRNEYFQNDEKFDFLFTDPELGFTRLKFDCQAIGVGYIAGIQNKKCYFITVPMLMCTLLILTCTIDINEARVGY